MKKKGVTMSMTLIVTIVILLIVAVSVLFIFRTYFGRQTDVIEEQLDGFEDEDGDGVRNFLDRCPYIPAGDNPHEQYDGCPAECSEPTKEEKC